jgi:choline dehydrogenase-like flavoprotein
VAIAEAIIPGSSSIPQADEATVARAEEVVRSFDPAALTLWNTALSGLSAAAVTRTGRPFHQLSATEQDDLLASWEKDPVVSTWLSLVCLVIKFVHFDRPDVYGAMGGKLNVVSGLEQPRWLRQMKTSADIEEGEILEAEVIVVGTGAGGAVVGRELAERGHAVLFVEEGEHHRRDAFDGSSVRAHQRFYRAAFSVGNAVIPIFIGRLFGGSTAVNGGTSYRTPDWVLDRWCEDMGTSEFTPDKMKPYFERVESFLDIAPSPRNVIGPIADVMARGCDSLGWSHYAVRRNAPGCDGSGFCDFGCRTDAKRGTNLSYMPAALERGSVAYTGLTVTEIMTDGGKATGVRAKTKDGRSVIIRAEAVILAGGTIPTPLLLLQQGLCNESGQVGRNLTLHPSSGFSALMDEQIRGHKHVPQGYGCDQFQKDGIVLMSAQPDRNIAWVLFPQTGRRLMEAFEHLDNIASFAILNADTTANGRIWRTARGLPAITYNLTPADVQRMHTAMIHAGEMAFAAGAKAVYPVLNGVHEVKGQKAFEAFKKSRFNASDFGWTSYHPLGTCKMGADPKTSVVDLDHETHAIDRLFIVDGSTVPGPLGVNPQVTIMAMATRAAERIAERL